VTVTSGGTDPVIALGTAALASSVKRKKNAASQSFEVWNAGGGTLDYSISDDASWLSVSPASGASTGEQDTVSVDYSTSALAAGTYTATITVSDPGAANSPRTIAVTLTVYKPGKISKSVAALSASATQGTSPAAQSFAVWNSGEDVMVYTLSDDAGWLSVSPSSGDSAGEQDSITVNYSASSLAAGTYAATITIASPDAENSPVQIPVTLVVSASSGKKKGGGGGGGSCALASAPASAGDAAAWGFPYLLVAALWVLSRLRRPPISRRLPPSMKDFNHR